jgi:hypothetical protein
VIGMLLLQKRLVLLVCDDTDGQSFSKEEMLDNVLVFASHFQVGDKLYSKYLSEL